MPRLFSLLLVVLLCSRPALCSDFYFPDEEVPKPPMKPPLPPGPASRSDGVAAPPESVPDPPGGVGAPEDELLPEPVNRPVARRIFRPHQRQRTVIRPPSPPPARPGSSEEESVERPEPPRQAAGDSGGFYFPEDDDRDRDLFGVEAIDDDLELSGRSFGDSLRCLFPYGNRAGTCVTIHYCPPLKRLADPAKINRRVIHILNSVRCRNVNFRIPTYCCPNSLIRKPDRPKTTKRTTPRTIITKATTPATTKATTPATTKATTPATTKATTPATTKATTPATSKATTPAKTKATTPVTTKATTPATTKATTPATTKATTPATSKATTPAKTKATTPATTKATTKATAATQAATTPTKPSTPRVTTPTPTNAATSSSSSPAPSPEPARPSAKPDRTGKDVKPSRGPNDPVKPGSDVKPSVKPSVKPPSGAQASSSSSSDGSTASATVPGASAVSETGSSGQDTASTAGATATTSGTAVAATGAPSAAGNDTEPGTARISGALTEPEPEPPQAGYLMPRPPHCGYRNVTGTRIVGGTESEIAEWPWMVACGYDADDGDIDFHCGGALITNKHVLTAAHCVQGKEDSLNWARIGDHDLTVEDDVDTAKNYRIKDHRIHEEYNNRTFANDIAILVLDEPVEFNYARHTVCLPFEDDVRTMVFDAKKPFIAGWGATSYRGSASAKLLHTQVRVMKKSACTKRYRRFRQITITDKVLCARSPGKDSCQGDSGGPMMFPSPSGPYFYTIGVVSFGYKCADRRVPGVYTRVGEYLDWIMANMHQTD